MAITIRSTSAPENNEAGDPFEVPGPYFLVQREFEMSSKRCRIESDNELYVGNFALKLIEFSASLLLFDVVRARNSHVEISFALDAENFEEVRRVAEVIFGLREPDESDAL